jgi:hypothetical protein
MGLGNEVIRRCISDACGRDGGNVSAFAGEVPKRNPRARGPRRPKGSIAKGSSVIFRCRRSPIIASPLICVPVAGSRLLPRHNFLFSKIWRCESALADKIRRTSGESRSKEGPGGGELIVMSAPTVVYGQQCVTCGGREGSGSKDMSKGRAFGSDGRCSVGSTANCVVGRMYPDVDRAGVSTEGRQSRMLLCTPILQIRLHWNVWSPNRSGLTPQAQYFVVSASNRGRRSFLFMAISKIQG